MNNYILHDIVSNAVKDAFNAAYQNVSINDHYSFLASTGANDTKEKYPFVSSYQENNWNMSRREEQISLDDFTYKLTENEKIVVEHPFSTPTSLYKFYSSSDFSIDAFTNHYLYATAPIEFNDILDSSWLLFDFQNITLNEYNKFYRENESIFPKRVQKDYADDKVNDFRTIKLHWYLYFSSKVGLISLSASASCPLMWAHYTNETGFAIEFDRKKLMQNMIWNKDEIIDFHLAPIQYLSKLQPLKFFTREFTTPTIPMTAITNIKHNAWRYEEEWRVSIRKPDLGFTTGVASYNIFNRQGRNDRKCHYSLDCVKAVYLSAYFLGSTYFEHSDTETLVVKPKYIPFLHYLFENHNNHLYFCGGDCTPNNEVKRSYQQIQLLRKDVNQFEIEFFPNVYYFDK